MKSRALVVSLHDVSPLTQAACQQMLAQLAELGVDRCSLLVIADHHHRGHFLADADFCAWLQQLSQAGHEIVMHGYHHRRARRQGESWAEQIMTRIYTADEGEFFDLQYEDARGLLTRARTEFSKLGLLCPGFIAPAWLLSKPAEQALVELGFDYTTRLGDVTDLQHSVGFKSQSLVWSVRSAWRRTISLLWNGSLFERLRANPLMRISIHPVDLGHAAIWKQIRSLVVRALADRQPLTYESFISSQRDRTHAQAA